MFIDTYELDGTLLGTASTWASTSAPGAHYTQFLVYDFDGDGRSEMMFKTAPGTKIIRYGRQRRRRVGALHHDAARRTCEPAYAHTDDYRLSAADYYEHIVEMFLGWQRHPEVVAGHWPATLEEAFGIAPAYAYPLNRADAEALADYFMDVYAPSRSARNNLRAFEGFIVDGPEYLTVFEGATGRELQTIRYKPGRHDDGLMWGDYAMPRIEPGNRVDRFLAGVAYLDGRQPVGRLRPRLLHPHHARRVPLERSPARRELVRRQRLDADDQPVQRLAARPGRHRPGVRHAHDAGLPLAQRRRRRRRRAPGDRLRRGHHRRRRQPAVLIVRRAAARAAPRPGRTSGSDTATPCTSPTSTRTGPGLEIFTVHEGATFAPYGMAMRDAATGEVLFGAYSGRDTGRGMIGDVLPDVRGIESWASLPGGSEALGVRTATGQVMPGPIPGTNQSIRWAADLTTQIVNGALDVDPDHRRLEARHAADGRGHAAPTTARRATPAWSRTSSATGARSCWCAPWTAPRSGST